jgi:hypothetical protein
METKGIVQTPSFRPREFRRVTSLARAYSYLVQQLALLVQVSASASFNDRFVAWLFESAYAISSLR